MSGRMINDAQREALFTPGSPSIAGSFSKFPAPMRANRRINPNLSQEMMLQIWRSLPGFRGQAKASTWIYRVCLNTALTWQRGQRKRESHAAPETSLEEISSGDPRPDQSHENAELLTELYRRIRELAPAERSLVVLALDESATARSAISPDSPKPTSASLCYARAGISPNL